MDSSNKVEIQQRKRSADKDTLLLQNEEPKEKRTPKDEVLSKEIPDTEKQSCGDDFCPNSFIPMEVLNDNAKSKSVAILGHMRSDIDHATVERPAKRALVLLNKSPFTESSAFDLLTCDLTRHQPQLVNDLYRMYVSEIQPKYNGIKTTMIYPATDRHIMKYRRQEIVTFSETTNLYEKHVKPFLEKHQFGLEWVYNIIEGRQEVERIIYRDADFLLLPDLKWSGIQTEDLYVVGLVVDRNIGSLRDLSGEHLPLLRAIHDKGKEIIEKRYALKKNKLRIYLHYQPSYYHLHVHFTHVRYDAPGFSGDKAHQLVNVIDNIERDPNYYQRCTLSYTLKEKSDLYTYLNDLDLI